DVRADRHAARAGRGGPEAGAPPPARRRLERHQAPVRGPAGAGAVAAAMRARTRHGRAGVSVSRTPSGASASSIAFAIAAGGEIAPPSPSPFMPSGLRGEGNSRWTVSIAGRSLATGTA